MKRNTNSISDFNKSSNYLTIISLSNPAQTLLCTASLSRTLRFSVITAQPLTFAAFRLEMYSSLSSVFRELLSPFHQ